jgi:hypothetical protein
VATTRVPRPVADDDILEPSTRMQRHSPSGSADELPPLEEGRLPTPLLRADHVGGRARGGGPCRSLRAAMVSESSEPSIR